MAGGIVGDPSSGTGSVNKQQGADKPLDKPSAEQLSSIQDRKSVTENTQSQGLGSENSASCSGPAASQSLGGQDVQASNAPNQHQTGGSTEKTQEEAGTGEKYVKSSGFAAEGGDFDATKPGAGKEADRKQ
jgi:hypothetical protein